jgi:hypothetical protein
MALISGGAQRPALDPDSAYAVRRRQDRLATYPLRVADAPANPQNWGNRGVQTEVAKPGPRKVMAGNRYILLHAGQPPSIIHLMKDGKVEHLTLHGWGEPATAIPANSFWRALENQGQIAVEMGIRYYDESNITEAGDVGGPWVLESPRTPWANDGVVRLAHIDATYSVDSRCLRGYVRPPGQSREIPCQRQRMRRCTLLDITTKQGPSSLGATDELKMLVETVTGKTLKNCCEIWMREDAERAKVAAEMNATPT